MFFILSYKNFGAYGDGGHGFKIEKIDEKVKRIRFCGLKNKKINFIINIIHRGWYKFKIR